MRALTLAVGCVATALILGAYAPGAGAQTVCPQIYNPVCGKNHVTYPNSCYLNAAGAKLLHDGACVFAKDSGCNPGSKYAVCGTDRETYSSECAANFAGPGPGEAGQCPITSDCICTTEFAPVCASYNGSRVTFANRCNALCVSATNITEGNCVDSCICTKIYKPVCGKDGKTYPNACEAGCAGTIVSKQTPCPCEYYCTKSKNYVCGADGTTYVNACTARCKGVVQFTYGKCTK